jgi:hypothetical protein
VLAWAQFSLQDADTKMTFNAKLLFPVFLPFCLHAGITLITPEQVHCGIAQRIIDMRSQVLASAFRKHPIRFKAKISKHHTLLEINLDQQAFDRLT